MLAKRLLALVAVIGFALGLAMVGDAVAGEYVKCRGIKHMVKWEQINVGDVDGHAIALYESKGVVTNLQGKTFADGWLVHEMGTFDFNSKTGAGSWQGYSELTSPEGDKVYLTWEGMPTKGPLTFIKGTGKYEGIKGKGTWSAGPPTKDPSEFYTNWEGEVELPR